MLFLYAAYMNSGNHGFLALNPSSTTIQSDDVTTNPISATAYVDRDGSLRKRRENAGSAADSAHGSWWDPADVFTDAGDQASVQVTHTGGTNRYASGDGLASFVAMTSDRSWVFTYAGEAGPNSDSSTYLFEFSLDGGSTTLDSFTYTIELDNLSP